MNEKELTVFLDLEWNCAAFTPEDPSVSAPLSPKQWARIISRHPEFQELCPFSEFTPDDWVVVLEKQLPLAWRCSCWKDFTPHHWQRLLRTQPTLLHYCEIPDHPAVRSGLLASGVMKRTSTRMTSRSGTGSGPSNTTPVSGSTVHAKNNSRNRCGGASFTVPQSC